MSLVAVKKFLGFLPYRYGYICDRCGRAMGNHPDITLCAGCAAILPSELRRHVLQYSQGLVCSLCKTKIEKRISALDACYACSAKHVDESHSGWSITSTFFISSLYQHCRVCGSVRFLQKDAYRNLFHEYLHVGAKFRVSQPIPCRKDFQETARKSHNPHDFLLIEDTLRQPLEEGLERYQEDLRAWQSGDEPFCFIADMMTDEILRARIFGSRVYWCWKCGELRKVVPRVHSETRATFDDPYKS